MQIATHQAARRRSGKRAGRAAAVLLAVVIPAAVIISAPAADAAPVVSLTLKAAPGTPVASRRCALVTAGHDFRVVGRLLADAAGVGVLAQRIELLVDGRRAAVATTDAAGRYAASLRLDPVSAHRIQATLRLPTDGTLVAPAASTLTSAVGIQSPKLATCAQPRTVVDPPKVGCDSCTPVHQPEVTEPPTRTIVPVHTEHTVRIADVTAASEVVPPPPSCSIDRSCPPPRHGCTGGSLCNVPGISALWHLPKHVPVLLVLTVVFCMAFPSGLFNSTLEANYEQVTGWFRGWVPARATRLVARLSRIPRRGQLALFVAAAGAASTLGTKHPLHETLPVLLGSSVAILVVLVAFELPKILQARRCREQYAGAIRCLPGALIAAFACAAGSRALGLGQPYVYGIVAAFAVTRGTRDERQANVGAAYVALSVGLLTVGAWALWSLVRGPVNQDHPAFVWLFVGNVLAGAFLGGFEGLLINFLPLRFLDGPRLRAWNRSAWVAVEAGALLLLVHVLSYKNPAGLETGSSSGGAASGLAWVLFVVFALGSFAFWGYFRLRGNEGPLARGPRELGPAPVTV